MTYRIIFTIIHALLWAAKDAGDIKAGKDIKHGKRWIMRAAIEIVASVAFACGIGDRPIDFHLVLLTIACGFLFSAVFRFSLNTMRGMHWNYLSPSSWYDWQFIRWTMRPIDREELVEGWHVYMAAMGSLRAGTIAYTFELLAFAIIAAIAVS